MSTLEATGSVPGLEPDLDRARELAETANVIPVRYRFIDDCETPVSAFLKLRGDGPAFLLESAEQGRLGRWSFLGFRPRAILRWSDGQLSEWGSETAAESGTGAAPDRTTAEPDPYAAAADYLARYEIAEPDELPPFAGGAVGFFGYDLVRTVEPLGQPNPDSVGLPDMALMITDVLLAFDHQRHEVNLIANAFVEDGGVEAAYARAVETIGEVRERLREPVPAVEPSPETAAIDFQSNMSREQFEATVSRIIEYVHAGDAFQVVPSQRFSSPCPVEAFSIYRGLRTVNPSPYMYFLDFGDFEIA
ncbi:MAG TPA: chorismate-binding protein, partial [Solirubrobacterales bacterium]|nr:chorismate-binding protein [Solirubrobacterales bacterium]